MTQRDALQGGRPPRRLPGMPGAALWREIAIGLGIALIGFLLALCVIRTGIAQPLHAKRTEGIALRLSHQRQTPVTGQFLPHQL